MKLTCMQLLMVALLATLVTKSSAGLQYNFYSSSSCRNAEEIIKNKVNSLIDGNPSIAAALIRLLFHDCFVTGCDGSILLDGSNSEKAAIPLAVAGYNAVDAIKYEIEKVCPGTVSCADILAFAARDSVNRSAGFYYPVNSGRRDRNDSTFISILTNMPSPKFSIQDLVARFAQKGLNIVDLVALSGAHSIGVAHCSSLTNRLYPSVDPALDPAFAVDLKQRCPAPGSGVPDNLLNNSAVSPTVLDNQFFKNALAKRVLFTSDAALLNRNDTATKVAEMAADPAKWIAQFAASMVKMGSFNVTTGTLGQAADLVAERIACLKSQGKEAFARGDYLTAIHFYGLIVEMDSLDATVFANKSLCWLRMRHWERALEDARKCRTMRPRWSKAWYREGAALSSMKAYKGAADAFREALRLDPRSEEIKEALRKAEKAAEETRHS